MHFYVTLTMNCNLQCRYCYGKCVEDFGRPFPFDIDDDLPVNMKYEAKDLARFLERDPNPTIIFYGGEPTLAIDKMQEIMDTVPSSTYMMQTNGLLLHRLGTQYANRFDTILVSLDGDEQLTDFYRGKGIYRRVIENLKLVRENGFRGEVIARMTVDPETNIRQAVSWLLSNEEFPFESVHWQLDAQFWQSDYEFAHIRGWFEQYNRDVRELVGDWIADIERSCRIPRVYPFLGIMESLLTGNSSKLRCGAGWTEFNVQTDGNIAPCPVMAGMRSFYLGNIWQTDPRSLRDAVLVREPCSRCSTYNICGGRCLYANATKLWGDEGYRLVCTTVENLVNSLAETKPRVMRMIANNLLSATDFAYPKYNSCEIIP